MTTDPDTRILDVDKVFAAVKAGHKTSGTIGKAAGIGTNATCVHLLALTRRGKLTRSETRPRQYSVAMREGPQGG